MASMYINLRLGTTFYSYLVRFGYRVILFVHVFILLYFVWNRMIRIIVVSWVFNWALSTFNVSDIWSSWVYYWWMLIVVLVVFLAVNRSGDNHVAGGSCLSLLSPWYNLVLFCCCMIWIWMIGRVSISRYFILSWLDSQVWYRCTVWPGSNLSIILWVLSVFRLLTYIHPIIRLVRRTILS